MFYLAIVLWLATLACGGIALLSTDDRGNANRRSFFGWAALCALVGVIFFGWSGVHSVPSRSIGVPVSLGQVGSGYANPGAHFTWDPFLHYEILDRTIQTTAFDPGGNLPGTSQCNGELPIRIGNSQAACAKITVQWKILPQAASALFNDYANHGDLMTTIQNNLVIRELEVVVNQLVGDYDPITDAQTTAGVNGSTSSTSTSSTFTGFGPAILQQMQTDLGGTIQVISVLYPYNTYSAQVEQSLQDIQRAHSNYVIAVENVATAAENALAFQKLGNPTINELIAQCLNDSSKNRTSPMGCFPGQSSGLVLNR